MGQTITVPIGFDSDFEATARAEGGVTINLAGTTLTARVWAGDDQEVLFTPAVELTDASNGVYVIHFVHPFMGGEEGPDITPGIYSLQVVVDDAARVLLAFDGEVKFTGGPGLATAAPVYGTYQDMLAYAPWLAKLQDQEDQAGFAEQRAIARAKLDEIIVARYKTPSGGSLGMPGSGASSSGSTLMPSKYLIDLLADDKLIIRPLTREIVAKLAIWFVCSSQVGPKEDNPYLTLAHGFRWEVAQLLKTYRAEIDEHGGYPSIVVDLGQTRLQ